MSYLESVAVIVAIVGVIYTILEIRICWLVNILASLLYFKVFSDTHLPGQMLLQLLYIAVGFYGYIFWGIEDKVKVKSFGVLPTLFLSIASILVGFILHIILPELLWADASVTAASVIATYLTTKKYLENWMLWIIIDLASIGLFAFRDLKLTAALYLAYTVLAVIGYIQWSKRLSTLSL